MGDILDDIEEIAPEVLNNEETPDDGVPPCGFCMFGCFFDTSVGERLGEKLRYILSSSRASSWRVNVIRQDEMAERIKGRFSGSVMALREIGFVMIGFDAGKKETLKILCDIFSTCDFDFSRFERDGEGRLVRGISDWRAGCHHSFARVAKSSMNSVTKVVFVRAVATFAANGMSDILSEYTEALAEMLRKLNPLRVGLCAFS